MSTGLTTLDMPSKGASRPLILVTITTLKHSRVDDKHSKKGGAPSMTCFFHFRQAPLLSYLVRISQSPEQLLSRCVRALDRPRKDQVGVVKRQRHESYAVPAVARHACARFVRVRCPLHFFVSGLLQWRPLFPVTIKTTREIERTTSRY